MNNQTANTTVARPYCLGDPEVKFTYTSVQFGVYVFLCTLFCVIAFVGNSFVIIAILHEHKIKKHKQNFYLLSLAVADALLVCLVVPFSLSNQLTGKWHFGGTYCRIYLSLDIAFCTASIWHIAMIGLDRYVSVKFPIFYRNHRSKKLIQKVIVGIWIYSALVSLLPNLFPTHLIQRTKKDCFINSAQWFILTSSSLSFFIPACIIIPVYTGVFLAGRKAVSHKKLHKPSETNPISYGKTVRNNRNTRKISGASNQRSLSSDSPTMQNMKKSKGFFGVVRRILSSRATRNADKTSIENNKLRNGTYVEPKDSSDPSSPTTSALSTPERKYTTLGQQKISNGNQNNPVVKSVSLQIRETRSDCRTEECLSPTSTAASQISDFEPKKQKVRMSHRERRFLIIILLVTSCLMFCWGPFFITYSIFTLCPMCCINTTLFNIVWWLGYLNSAANPIIYSIFNQDFRNAFKKILHLHK